MNRIWRNGLTGILLFCLMMTCSIPQGFASNEPPTGLTAKGAVLIDMTSGQVLFEQNKDARLAPASITKNLTAILALEHGDLNATVKTSKLAREQVGNRVYLDYDEEQPLEQLIYGLMINSGNDAAVAIAEHIGGSVEAFAELMNQKAAELGATQSHFVNPSGLHDDNHYTTPYDMVLIANYAMKHPKFRQIVRTQTYEWKGQVWQSTLVNLNRMLWEYEGATGIKTGFTDQAQQTITVSAKRGDREVLAVLMGVQSRPQIRKEATMLLDYGLTQFTTTKIASAGETITTFDASGKMIPAVLAEDVYHTHEIGTTPNFEKKVTLSPPTPPYFKNANVGVVEFQINGEPIASKPLFAGEDVIDVLTPPIPPDEEPSVMQTILSFAFLLLLSGLIWFLLQKKRRPPTSGSPFGPSA